MRPGAATPYGEALSNHDGKGPNMPFNNVKLIEAMFPPTQKQEIVRKLTASAFHPAGCPTRDTSAHFAITR